LLTFKLTVEKMPITKNIDTPLEVSLVNSRSEEAPDKADFLAQHNLRGGGEYDKHAFTTPLPAINDGNGELIKLIKKQEQSSETQQKQLLAEESSFTVNQNNNAANKQSENTQQGRDSQTINQEIAKLEAEINKQIQQMAKRPKRMAFTAANAKSVVYAKYYDNIRGSIEEYGTTYFPKDSNGNPMYGELILIIRINKEGKLGYNKDQYYATSVEVARSSGNPLLDKRAMEIVKACAPFGIFPADMAQSIDILEVISTFKFNKQGFATTLQGH
jgi:protein TonB